MDFEVIIPTRGDLTKLENLLRAINGQSLYPKRINIIIDKQLNKQDAEEIAYFIYRSISEYLQQIVTFTTNLNSDFKPYYGVSYVRNFGITNSKYDYLFFIDDDNIFESLFFEKIVNTRIVQARKIKNHLLLAPTMVYRKTNIIQFQGFKFNYWLSKVEKIRINKDVDFVEMLSGNTLFGSKEIFEKIMFDNNFMFVYEDLDFSYRAYKQGFPLMVSKSIVTNHMESKKTKLRQLYLTDPITAYQKSRNRILMVKKSGKKLDKYKFLFVGLRIQTLWFLIVVLIYGNDKINILKAIFLGIKDGLKKKY